MNLLRVPVTETVTASYLIPLRTTMTVTEARQRTIKAVGAHVPDPLRATILHWIHQGAVTVQVTAAPATLPPLPDGMSNVMAEQLMQLARSPAFVRVTATSAASLIVVHE
jgi:hypothetical protein